MNAVAAVSLMQIPAEISGNPRAGVWESRHSYSNNLGGFWFFFFLSPALTKYITGLESTVWAKARLVLRLQLCVCACVRAFLLTLVNVQQKCEKEQLAHLRKKIAVETWHIF